MSSIIESKEPYLLQCLNIAENYLYEAACSVRNSICDVPHSMLPKECEFLGAIHHIIDDIRCLKDII